MISKTSQIQYPVPRANRAFHYSRAALGLLGATLFLIVILVFSTLQNINRAEMLMEKFLLDKGETVIRSIEAGSRATMMHHMGGSNPLHTLLEEFAKDSDILYISVIAPDGRILEHVGSDGEGTFRARDLSPLSTSIPHVTKLNKDQGVFNLAKVFKPAPHRHTMRMGTGFPMQARDQGTDLSILAVGLLTKQFDVARKQDIRHTIFMGAILFLVGSAGLYFLFLYQKMRLTSSNLADMEVYTQNIIESIPVAILTLDAADRIVSCNGNTEELFESPLMTLQGKDLECALPNFTISIEKACQSRIGYETVYSGGDGKTTPLRIGCSPLLNNEDVIIGKVLIIQDLSLIKEMEMQLERSRRMAALGKMAAGIAHEIRNPLGTLRGFAQYFGGRPDSGEDGKNYSQLMISEIDRLNQTVSGLLQFSRPREPQPQDFTADQLFAKTITMMEADIASKNVDLSWQRNTGICIHADPDLMLQVLMNLLKNSLNATADGGKISLSCTGENHHVTISVTDSGSGMTPEIRERMFDPFFTTTPTGTGLGLAVSHQIVEQHGGMIEVQTEPGAGTSIAIRLPRK